MEAGRRGARLGGREPRLAAGAGGPARRPLLAGRAGDADDAGRALLRPAPSPSTCRGRRPCGRGATVRRRRRLYGRAARRLDLRARRGRASSPSGEPPRDQEAFARGERLGWAYRDKLTSQVGRLLLTAWLGPKYPGAVDRMIAQIAAWQAAAAAEPAPAGGLVRAGRPQLHDGATNDLPRPGRAAPRTSFRRALELAPSWVLPLDHLILTQLDLDDTVGLRALASPLAGAGHRPGRPLATTCAGAWARPGRFRAVARSRRGARPLERRRAVLAGGPGPGRGGGFGRRRARRSARSSAVRSPGPSYGTRGFPARLAAQYRPPRRGGGADRQPGVGRAVPGLGRAAADRRRALLRRRHRRGSGRGALARPGDSRIGPARPGPGDAVRVRTICRLGFWAMGHGDGPGVRRWSARLRAERLEGLDVFNDDDRVMCADLLDAWLAWRERRPEARGLLDRTRLRSTSRATCWTTGW